jgi:HlyD family secretion protein
VASVLAVTVAGCGGGSDTPVRIAIVGRATVVEVVAAPAVVTARATATVIAPADGVVSLLRVREGQRVRAGQVLLLVGSPDAQRRLRLARRADARVATGLGHIGVAIPTRGVEHAADAARRDFSSARRAALRLPTGPARRQATSVLRVLQSQYVAARSVTDQAPRQVAAAVRSISAAISGLSSAQRLQTREGCMKQQTPLWIVG